MPRVDDAYLASRRSEIVDAAMTCFSRDGFHRTTMQDIVRESGLSAGAIYRYFAAKEDIIAAIAELRHAPEAAVLDEVSKGSDLGGVLRALIEVSLGRLADPDEQRWRRVNVQVWAEALRDEHIMRVVRGGLDGPIAVLADLVRRGQEAGTVDGEIDAVAAARFCASIFYGLVLQQAWDPEVDVVAYMNVASSMLDGFVG
jgi:AcrR family transcriptional regulator